MFNIDIAVLKSEMLVAKNCVLRVCENQELNIDDVKRTVTEDVYPTLYKILKVALTIPVSSSTSERSFSAMRRIKTWLRTSMWQDRFTNLSLLHIERDLSNNLCVDTLLNEFIKMDNRFKLKLK